MKRIAAFLFAVILLFSVSPAYAWPGWGYHHPSEHHWYRGHWWLGESLVDRLVVGTIVASLPPSPKVVYVNNVPYYYDGTYYFQTCPNGYQVVPAPANVAAIIPAGEVAMPLPPPPRQEVVIAAPYPRSVWVPGHWKWRKRFQQYVWIPGHWKRA